MRYLVLGTSAYDTLLHVSTELNDISDDMYLWADSTVQTIGSTGAGKALALDALGADVDLITDIAKDAAGNWIRTFFSDTNVGLHVVDVDKTTQHTNIMHGADKRISIVTAVPTIVPKRLIQADKLIESADFVFLNINDYCRDYIPQLKAKGSTILVDIHDYDPPNPYHAEFIEAADILVASGVKLPDHEAFLEEQINQGKQLVVITKGKRGLIAMDHKRNRYELPGYNDVPSVDANGAGDSFCAGLGMRLAEGADYKEALEFATICGAVACTDYPLYNRAYDRNRVEIIKKSFFG